MDKRTVWFVLTLAFGSAAFGQTADELAELEARKKAAELQAAIEKANLEVQQSKQAQLNIAIGTSPAQEGQKKAEAEKAELAAKLPAVEAKALAGTVGTEGVKLLAMPPIIDRLKSYAGETCSRLGAKVFPYDKSVVDGVTAAHVLRDQLQLMNQAHQVAQGKATAPASAKISPMLALGAASTIVKAGADFLSLFKTNITTGKVEVAEARAMFLTMLASHCAPKLLYLPGSYMGELDLAPYRSLLEVSRSLLSSRYDTERLLDTKRADLAPLKATEKKYQDEVAALEAKKPLSEADKQLLSNRRALLDIRQAANKTLARDIAGLENLVKDTDVFLQGLKTSDVGGSAPLLSAARFLALADLARDIDVQILDIDVKAEAVTILKENLFTGQRLRVTGSALVSYRLLDTKGTILQADVKSLHAETREVPLR